MSHKNRPSHGRHVLRFGSHEIVTEGIELGFWADISHRCMTASWPSFVAGAATLFLIFNALFAALYWIGDNPVANVPGGAYVDYLYFSIETLSTAGYGDMHPQTHYGHLIATIELFTGIFSMSLMTGLIFARFSRPKARLLFADHPVISTHDGKPTLMVRFANERHDMITGATARLWMVRVEHKAESREFRRFVELRVELHRVVKPAATATFDSDAEEHGVVHLVRLPRLQNLMSRSLGQRNRHVETSCRKQVGFLTSGTV